MANCYICLYQDWDRYMYYNNRHFTRETMLAYMAARDLLAVYLPASNLLFMLVARPQIDRQSPTFLVLRW